MSERAPYSRVYWQIRADDRLISVYPNDANLAAWLRLLLAADMAWPAPADLPRNVKASSVTALEAAGVIARLPGGLFTFHGLDTERGRRRDLATTRRGPDGDRTVPKRDPDENLAEPSRAKPSTSRAEAPREDAPDPADTYWSVTGKYPTDKTLAWIDDLTARFGAVATSKAVASVHVEDATVSTLLGRVKERLTRDARQLDRAERVDEAARLKEKRAAGSVIQDHNWGRHTEANPECRYCREGAA